MSWIADVGDLVSKLRSSYFVTAAAIGALLLALPTKATDAIGVTNSISGHHGLIVFGTLASLAIAVGGSWDEIKTALLSRLRKRRIIADIRTLSNGEYLVLLSCLDSRSRSLKSGDGFGNAAALVQRGMLEAGTEVGAIRVYIIPAWLWKHLEKNRDLYLSRYELLRLDDKTPRPWSAGDISKIR